jgi:heptosyltransferase-1
MPGSLKNILIIKPSALGDIVMALPALSALRRSFPDARISWLVRTVFAPLLKNHPCLNETILFDRKYLGKSWRSPAAFGSLLSFLKQLKQTDYDVVFDFQGLFRTAFFAWRTGCPNRFGMANAREFGHIFYTDKIKQGPDTVHLVDYYLKIVRTAGAGQTDVEFILPEDKEAVDSVRGLLTSHGLEPGNFVVIVTGSAHEDKCWPVERFAQLADKVSSHFNIPVVATGSAGEIPTIEKLQNLTRVPVVSFAGQTSLGELIELLRFSKLVVSNDTGPGHIAAALGKPVVLIFGRSNPARVAPYGRMECVAAVEPLNRGLKADSFDPKYAIEAVTFSEVYKKVCGQISTQKSVVS